MKRIAGRGLFLAGLLLAFSNSGVAAECEPDVGRTDLCDAGEAEVIAGTGYQHTLFDSAENKCQNCHNDLYDTWKKSMHAKSWVDPIFQAKYQDFLRLQASKIGASTDYGTYTEGTIQKTGRVCIKCHAPTAYYSNDYDISLQRIGGNADDPGYEPSVSYSTAKGMETNLAPKFKPALPATVASMGLNGQAYTVTYHIGNEHNQEGINCAYCHSVETVRMFSADDGDDKGQYTLANPIKAGPIGPKIYEAGAVLEYSPYAHAPDMNAFFGLIGPEIYFDFSATPDAWGDFDVDKKADGRYTMKGVPTGCGEEDKDGDGVLDCHYTGGPFYGPFGVTGLSNSRPEDTTDRVAQVKQSFQDAVDAEHGDKFTSKHQFAAYGKALCLSCHQRSSLALNPEEGQFLELCSTWTAMSDGVGNNFEDTRTSPKCQRCHMEPLERVTAKEKNDEDKWEDWDDVVRDAVVLHKWDDRNTLFTTADTSLTHHFLPPSDGGTEGPVAEGYLNNHAFMGANKGDFGLVKIKTGFESGLVVAEANAKKLKLETYLKNKTAHMFPGAHPMRRVLTRIVVTDANGDKVPFSHANGKSKFGNITNQLATLEGNVIKPGFETVEVAYDRNSDVVIQGYTPDLDGKKGEPVSSQFMDTSKVSWTAPDATVFDCDDPTRKPDPNDDDGNGVWKFDGCTTVKKITDIVGGADHFTRIYGRETGKSKTGLHVVRPGFDSNIASDNRLKPNEREQYTVTYKSKDAVYPLTVKYKVYYLKKGGSGKFPECKDATSQDCEYGFLDTSLPAGTLKKLAIWEVFDYEEEVSLD